MEEAHSEKTDTIATEQSQENPEKADDTDKEDEKKEETEDKSLKSPKKRKKRKREKTLEQKSVNTFDIPGVTKLFLSSDTQKAVSCVVGDDVTAESQWKYIKKERVVDNLDLYEEDSEFLSLKDDLIAYPEPEILIGFIPEESLAKDLFYVVHDVKAKALVLMVIEKKKKQLEDSLTKAVFKPVGKWVSQGSELDIDMNIIKSYRPLYEIDLTSRFPVYDTNVKFKERKVEDVRDGYVELIYDPRYPISTVSRIRVDAIIQASPNVVSREAQTTPTYPQNIGTQHEFILPEPPKKTKKLDAQAEKQRVDYEQRLTKFVVGHLDHLSEKIVVNKHINVHVNDYADLVQTKQKYKVHSEETEILRSYSDVDTCHNKYANDASWNRILSGIMAVSYSSVTVNCIETVRDRRDEVLDAIFNYTPVLIWDYKDTLKPKLFLESPRQVVYVRCSPFYKNIVVGGCINGQVVVWNLGDKLESTSKLEILSSSQQMTRLNLQKLISWMKNIYNPTVIKPMIVTHLLDSHRDMVTSITWMAPDRMVTGTGKMVEIGYEEEHSDQFFTSSLDGSILFWDFKQDETVAEVKPQKRSKRLSRRPSALLKEESEFPGRFKPHYKLNFNEGEKVWPILCMLRTYVVHYEAVGKVSEDISYTNRYKFVNKSSDEYYPLICTSSVGQMCQFTWEGLEYHPGKMLYCENVTYKQKYLRVHDGPIVVTSDNKFWMKIFVTIGGRIFAVWNCEEEKPMFWRKCQKRGCYYVGGGWSEDQPSYILVTRSDGYIELWDLLFNAVRPTRLIPLAGTKIMNTFGFLTPKQVRKKVLISSDYFGTITVYKEPDLFNIMIPGEKEKIKQLFERDQARTKTLQAWMKNINETLKGTDKHDSVIKSNVSGIISPHQYKVTFKTEHDKAGTSELERMDRIFNNLQSQTVNEKLMYENILKKKKINLAELELQKKPLQKIAMERREKLKRQEQILSNKSKIFETATSLLFEDVSFDKNRVFSLPHVVDKSIGKYIEQYDEIEDRALNYVDRHQFELIYNRSAVIERAKRRQKKVKQNLHLINRHERYTQRKKLAGHDYLSEKSIKTMPYTITASDMSYHECSHEENDSFSSL